MHFSFITYSMMLYKQQYTNKNTDIEKMQVYSSERSERAQKIWAFSHPKTAISFNIFVGTLHILSQKHLISGPWQITFAYIIQSLQVWCHKRQYTDKH